jgi:type IV pilus assembly protein PilB
VEPSTATRAEPAQNVWRPHARRLLGDVLVDLGMVSRPTVEAAVVKARALNRPMGQVLLEEHALTADQLASAVAERFALDHLRLEDYQVDMGAAHLVSPSVAKRLGAVPVGFHDDRTLLVAMVNPSNVLAMDDIAMITDYRVLPAVVSDEDLQALLARLNRLDEGLIEEAVDEEPDEELDLSGAEADDDAPTVKLVKSIIAQAVDQGASDVHFDPDEGELQVRFRIDGVMVESARVPRRMAPKVVSRVKILADLDISERRLPQDGRVGMAVDGRRIDLRVVTVPLVAGESVVLRILDSGGVPLTIDELGMEPEDRTRFQASLKKSYGGILTTGPTGSGKSTSLYAALMTVRSPEKTVMTIEDPVEYRLTGVKQLQVSERAGLTFATGLRSMMRSDPDVIMVGEIRDRESAHIAVEAALTGHLILSTLHTRDAPSAATRLVDMGIEPYLVASSIDCVVAQRLARRLCSVCRQATDVPAADVGLDQDGSFSVFEPGGCSRCRGTGYKGRLGLFEVLTITHEVKQLIVQRASADAIAEMAVSQGMRRLRDDGLAKVRAGETSLAEVGRVIG